MTGRLNHLGELQETLKTGPLAARPELLRDLKIAQDIVQWAIDQQPFQVGDFVRYTKAGRLAPDHGWYHLKDLLLYAPMEVVKVQFNTHRQSWSAEVSLSRYEFWAYKKQDDLLKPLTSLLHITMEHLTKAYTAEHDSFMEMSKAEMLDKQREHEAEKRSKEKCACRCGCKECGA